MRLFAERGFGGTTVDDIAEAAGVSRATVFTYYPTKEEIVFGEAASAVEGLAARLREGGGRPSRVVRAWIAELTGWLEPELLVQMDFAARRRPSPRAELQLFARIEDVIAAALERELGPEQQLAARLSAASLMAGLCAVEESRRRAAVQRRAAPRGAEPDRILDVTIGYVEAGMAAVYGAAEVPAPIAPPRGSVQRVHLIDLGPARPGRARPPYAACTSALNASPCFARASESRPARSQSSAPDADVLEVVPAGSAAGRRAGSRVRRPRAPAAASAYGLEDDLEGAGPVQLRSADTSSSLAEGVQEASRSRPARRSAAAAARDSRRARRAGRAASPPISAASSGVARTSTCSQNESQRSPLRCGPGSISVTGATISLMRWARKAPTSSSRIKPGARVGMQDHGAGHDPGHDRVGP